MCSRLLKRTWHQAFSWIRGWEVGMKRCASLTDIAQEKQFVAALPTLLEMGFLWEMGFVLIRHSVVDLRKAILDRVPKVLCEIFGKIGEASERELVLVVSVKSGKEWDMTVDDNCFRTQRCAILILPALEPRVFAWWNVVNLFSMCCSASVRAVWVGVLFTLSVGCLEVFLQSTEAGPKLRKNSRSVRPWRMLGIPTSRRPMGSIPICWPWRSCRQVSPPLLIEPPACLRVNQEVVFFDALECLSFSLSNLLTARDGSVVLLSPCQVLVVHSPFAWAKSGRWLSGCWGPFAFSVAI